MASFSYVIFGLNICSDIQCNSLLPGRGDPDVHVRLGPVPEQLSHYSAEGVLYQASTRQFLLKINHIARYLVSNGSEIIVDPAPGAEMDAVRLFLFGSVFGAMLHQR